jgi:hypothetical protein
VYLVKLLYNIKPSENINYYILLNPLKRKLPNKKSDIISAKNINGGFTYINSNNIYIIRKEDYEKVIIHELLHHNNIIHHEDWKEKNIKILKKLCNIANDQVFIPNEAIIETFAIILIVKKIIDKQDNKLWRENTHCYCYIVLRAVFYIYFKDFIKTYVGKNDDYITIFICKYFPKIMSRIKKVSNIKKDNFIKQTIFYNF